MQPINRSACELEREVLPTAVRPIHYDLTIEPDFTNFTFKGRAIIDVEVKEETSVVTMNATELKFQNVSVSGAKAVSRANMEVDEPNERVAFSLVDNDNNPIVLEVGSKISLAIEYSGDINDKLAGFYRSTYEDKASGEKRVIGVTQFEATDARKAFPCWDEPAAKATFSISLIIPEDLVGLSNMDEASREKKPDGKVFIKFNKTPVMSTYLVAWIVGDLESVETVNDDGIQVRVFAPRGDANQGKFALDVAARTLVFFTRYFDIPYPLPKMDLVAIPDFGAGAMENWGLVTYRTVYLLFDEQNSSLMTKQRIAYVVGHELAHQWFGNLVTMEWWSDLWLNEGFATWVGWLATDHLFPEWDIWTEFVMNDCQSGLSLDGLRSSHPIEVPVRSPSEISQIFDSISYSKGASLIRMLVAFLGETSFKTGLRQYLKKHKLGNAKTADLWDSLAEASGQPVADIMNTWTQTIGYPVVKVEQDTGCKLHLHQSRFLSTGDVKPEEDKTIWSIPVNAATAKNGWKPYNPSELLRSRSGPLDLCPDDSVYKLNKDQVGFFRVNYPTDHWAKLGEAIKASELNASDRIGIISDIFSLSVAGSVSAVQCLQLLQYFDTESDHIVWGELSSRLSEFLSVWWEEPEEQLAAIRQLVRQLYATQVKALGFDSKPNEGDKVALLRPLAIGMAGKAGDQEVLKEARSRFDRFIAGDSSAIHPNLRGIVYTLVVRNGGRPEFDAVFKIFREQTIADQKLAALGALGASPDPAVISAALNLTLQTEPVRPQDAIYIFSTVGANPKGRRIGWQFVKDNWPTFHTRYYKSSFSLLARIISTSTNSFTTIKDMQDVEDFFSKRDQTSIDRTIRQSLERIRLQASWLERNRDPVAKWLQQFVRIGRIAA